MTGGVEKSSYVTSVSPGHIHYQHSLKIKLISRIDIRELKNGFNHLLKKFFYLFNTKFMSARVHKAIVSNNSWLTKKIVDKQILKIKQIK